MALSPCISCQRHRRVDSGSVTACPFCGGTETVASEPRPVARTATRAALVFGGMALGIVGCVSKSSIYGGPPEPRPDAGTTMETVAPVYGGPPVFTLPDGQTTYDPPPPPQGPPPPPLDAGATKGAGVKGK